MLNAIAIVRMCESEWQRGDRSIETVIVRRVQQYQKERTSKTDVRLSRQSDVMRVCNLTQCEHVC